MKAELAAGGARLRIARPVVSSICRGCRLLQPMICRRTEQSPFVSDSVKTLSQYVREAENRDSGGGV